MSEGTLTPEQQKSLLLAIREIWPDARYAPEESFTGTGIRFKNECGCYSEYTTDSCDLEVFIKIGPVAEWEDKNKVDDLIEAWAKVQLSWNGCDSCENHLSVFSRVFDNRW